MHDAWWFGIQLFTTLRDWAQEKNEKIIEDSLKVPEYKSQLTSKEVEQSERSIKNKSKFSDRAKSTDSGLPNITQKKPPKPPERLSLDPIFLRVLVKRFSLSLGQIQGDSLEILDGLSKMGSQDAEEPSSLLTDVRSRRSSSHKRQTFGRQFHAPQATPTAA